MTTFKCKKCGGTIEFGEGASVGVCKKCGAKQFADTDVGGYGYLSQLRNGYVPPTIRDYVMAEKRRQKKHLIVWGVILSFAVALVLFGIMYVTVIIPRDAYNDAVELMNNGEYDRAISDFNKLKFYKDSEDLIDACYAKKYGDEKWNTIKSINVGDTYKFGSYEQDNNFANGKEKIEWIVLDKRESRILLVSKYALDAKPFNTSNAYVAWDTCSLRSWLNETFINEAFDKNEISKIQMKNIYTGKNPLYDTNPGKKTTDSVFLLSINEVETYFSSDAERACRPTVYAVANGANTGKSETGLPFWWTRSPGGLRDTAANVGSDGSVRYYGNYVSFSDVCVRPAIWVDLSK